MTENVNSKVKVGVSIGGTHCASKAFNLALQPLDLIFERSLNPEAEQADTLTRIRGVVGDMITGCRRSNHEVIGVGIGAPGPMNMDTGQILNTPNLKGLRDVALKEILEKEFGVPVFVNNDANAQGLGELSDEPNDCQDLVLITLGSGTGVAYIKERRIVNGRHYMGNEHAVTNLNAFKGFGIEQICSTQGIIGLYFLYRGAVRKLEETISPEKIAMLARNGYAPAISAYEHMGLVLGNFYAILVNTLDPDVIVYSGGIAESDDLFREAMIAAIQAGTNVQAFNGIEGVVPPLRIKRSRLGEKAQIIGAAMLVPNP